MSTINYQQATSNSALSVPLLDLKAQYDTIRDEIDAAVAEVFESQRFILGPQVERCEAAVAEYSQCEYGVGVSSGTDALLICLMAEGIGPGDEVITTPYSFFATAGCIARVGATPVFVDIDPLTFNIDAAQIEAAITDRTKAIIPVHLFGQMAHMDPIEALARDRQLVIIEDAAQAIGAEYGRGKGVGNLLPERPGGCFAQKVPDPFSVRRAGSIGHYGCFSFFPSKNLGAAGDGGMVVTNDAARAQRLKSLRNHGAKPKYFHKFIGGNFRLDALQAAVVNVKLKYLDAWTAQRQNNAARYDELFQQSGLVERGLVTLPGKSGERRAETKEFEGNGARTASTISNQKSNIENPFRSSLKPETCHLKPVYNQYVIRVPQRDDLREHLKAADVGCEVYYPRCLHEQDCFQYLGYKSGDFPHSEKAAAETLALPIYPELSDEQLRYVANEIHSYFGH